MLFTGVFLLCWVPFFTINIINAICIRYDLFDDTAVCQIDPILSDRSDPLLVPRLARLHEQLSQPRHLHHLQHGVPTSIQEDSPQPVQLPMITIIGLGDDHLSLGDDHVGLGDN